ncbi:MAG TPA: hypothetical protein VIK53_09740 [Verrucomicrobiae bacterium]
MDADERDIFDYLKTWGSDFISAKEICRRAGTKKRYHEDNDWAKVVLVRMVDRGILESDSLGRYRIKPVPKKSKQHRWVAPDINKILKEGGVQVEGTHDDIASDEHYDQL